MAVHARRRNFWATTAERRLADRGFEAQLPCLRPETRMATVCTGEEWTVRLFPSAVSPTVARLVTKVAVSTAPIVLLVIEHLLRMLLEWLETSRHRERGNGAVPDRCSQKVREQVRELDRRLDDLQREKQHLLNTDSESWRRLDLDVRINRARNLVRSMNEFLTESSTASGSRPEAQ